MAKRIYVEFQFQTDVTVEEYLSFLRGSMALPETRIALYERHGNLLTAFVAQNNVPLNRLGSESEPYLYTVYSVDYGTIITGYLVRGLETISLPENVLWL